ncbi:hypothetical protein [Candidatus Babela massiliensis]|uniref:Uncharacterized protein n=1 Tax=Candidatus Babela massiliensis TaxID=673862 RepID=V6DGW5_9BACT|nr:hypothetical protein [Candidatus Babela massiliensis]CDK30789.1 hypothetical protein BABL1_gene_226 [Candidatus Babela massiliensis]
MFYKVYLIILSSLFINFNIVSMSDDIAYFQQTNTDFKEILKANNNRIRKLKQELLISKQKNQYNYIKFCFLGDLINILKEINKIRVLGSFNEEVIHDAALLDRLFNSLVPFSIIPNIYYSLNSISYSLKQDRYVNFARFINFMNPILNFLLFDKREKQIEKNAYKISKYNKETNKTLSGEKFVQYNWLLFNKISPYLVFVLSRNYEKLALNSYNVFEIAKALSNMSEIVRKHFRYKVEMRGLYNYKA